MSKNKKKANKMETQAGAIEPVTLSDILQLSSWNRPRTSDELQNFIETGQEAMLRFAQQLGTH